MTQKISIFRETTLQTHRTSRCIRNIFIGFFWHYIICWNLILKIRCMCSREQKHTVYIVNDRVRVWTVRLSRIVHVESSCIWRLRSYSRNSISFSKPARLIKLLQITFFQFLYVFGDADMYLLPPSTIIRCFSFFSNNKCIYRRFSV
jgi:hypothetical protein